MSNVFLISTNKKEKFLRAKKKQFFGSAKENFTVQNFKGTMVTHKQVINPVFIANKKKS